MGETDEHRFTMVDGIDVLSRYYIELIDIYVSGNILVHYVEGNRRIHVSPDLLVVKGVPKRPRLNYLVWREGKGPDFVLEVTSKSTRKEDLTKKRLIYQDILKVPEYFLFDPYHEYLDPPLQGFRLEDGIYRSIEPVAGMLPSEVLGLSLVRERRRLRFFDPMIGSYLLNSEELAAREKAGRLQAERAERREAERRRQAEAATRSEAEKRLQAEADASNEAERRRQAEAEIERLRREIEAMKAERRDDSTR